MEKLNPQRISSTVEARLATTHTDRIGHKLSEGALRGMLEDIKADKDARKITFEHKGDAKGEIIDVETNRLDDGELALDATVGIYEEYEDDAKQFIEEGGTGFSYSAHTYINTTEAEVRDKEPILEVEMRGSYALELEERADKEGLKCKEELNKSAEAAAIISIFTTGVAVLTFIDYVYKAWNHFKEDSDDSEEQFNQPPIIVLGNSEFNVEQTDKSELKDAIREVLEDEGIL